MSISAVIIAKNEEQKIKDAIKSVSFCDEVLVIDTGSTDDTVPTAKKLGARVFTDTNKMNYAAWRNRGLKEAHGDWVLYIDADERVSPELAREVRGIFNSQFSILNSAYAIPRKNFIFAKEFRYSGQWPDYQKRLYRKSSLARWIGKLHEEPVFSAKGRSSSGGKGNLGYLKAPLLHYKHNKLSEMVDKTNEWSDIEAKLLFDAKHPPLNIPRFFSSLIREFWLRMIVQLAFLDGSFGIIYALYQVFSKGVTYAKLWELQIKDQK